MSFAVNINIDHAFAIYEIFPQGNGVYIARLLQKSYHVIYSFPETIRLFKSGQEWTSDHNENDAGMLIVRKIDEELKQLDANILDNEK